MSNEVNTDIIEKALSIAEEYVGTPLHDAILNNIERGDLHVVAQLVKETEDYWMAEAYGIGQNDEY